MNFRNILTVVKSCLNSNEHGNINGYQTYPPIKKGKSLVTEILPTFGEIVPSLVHTPVFHGWLPPCPQVLLSSQGPKNCTVLPAACWSRSSWDRITIKILRWFCWLFQNPYHSIFFNPILRFLRIFVNFRGFWPLFEMMTIQGLRAEAEWPADWTRSTCFLLLWSQRGRKYIAFLLFSYILCDTDKEYKRDKNRTSKNCTLYINISYSSIVWGDPL